MVEGNSIRLLGYDAVLSVDVAPQRTTRRHIPEDDTLHNHRCENLKSYVTVFVCSFMPEESRSCQQSSCNCQYNYLASQKSYLVICVILVSSFVTSRYVLYLNVLILSSFNLMYLFVFSLTHSLTLVLISFSCPRILSRLFAYSLS
jgi:hypothetical protein